MEISGFSVSWSGNLQKARAMVSRRLYVRSKIFLQSWPVWHCGGIDDIRSTNPDDIAKAKNYVRMALDELLAGKEVSVQTSQPYGCSVKYK